VCHSLGDMRRRALGRAEQNCLLPTQSALGRAKQNCMLTTHRVHLGALHRTVCSPHRQSALWRTAQNCLLTTQTENLSQGCEQPVSAGPLRSLQLVGFRLGPRAPSSHKEPDKCLMERSPCSAPLSCSATDSGGQANDRGRRQSSV
jgi:hypothetical protein